MANVRGTSGQMVANVVPLFPLKKAGRPKPEMWNDWPVCEKFHNLFDSFTYRPYNLEKTRSFALQT